MDITTLLLDNCILIAELLGLWVMLGSNVHLKKTTIVATRVVILLIALEAILWHVERWTRELDYLTGARVFLTPTIYLLHPIILIGIIDMMGFIKKGRLIFYLPVLISIPLLYTSQWTHLVFWFTDENLYISAEGIIKYYPYLLFLFYVFVFLGNFIFNYAKRGTAESRGILVSVVAATVGVALHIFYDIEVDYSTLFASLLVLYYLSLYIMTAKEDTLTHLLNRQCYFYDSKRLKGHISAVASVDMNDLKKTNDTKGHQAGDTAIITVSDCLTKNRMKGKKVYRIGGDEFAIFYLDKTEQEVKNDIAYMKMEMSSTIYNCAFGYQMVVDGNVKEAMEAADKRMYKNKAMYKGTDARRIAAHKEATIRVMHEALGSGMWGMEFDENGKMISVEWSPEFRRMLGYSEEEEFPNLLESWSDLLHPDDKERVLKEYHETISDYTGQKTYNVEYRLMTKSGEYRLFHAIGRLLRRDNGVPLSYVGMFVDITNQKL
ncbi:MAG: diguanylate cyclase [Lachnospiraceae bacterium]|nr:diguanylate cyclase [Lachnospiraceae bacterium]